MDRSNHADTTQGGVGGDVGVGVSVEGGSVVGQLVGGGQLVVVGQVASAEYVREEKFTTHHALCTHVCCITRNDEKNIW